MNRVRFIALMLMCLFAVTLLGGCTIVEGGRGAYIYERPAVGLTAEDELTTEMDVKGEDSLTLSTQDGVIRITRCEGEKLQVIEKRKLTGPASGKVLEEMLEKSRLQVIPGDFEIRLKAEEAGTESGNKNENTNENTSGNDNGKPKSLFRMIRDIELRIPEKVKTVNIDAKSGGIVISGVKGVSIVNLTLSKGNIEVKESEIYLLNASVTDGNLEVEDFQGTGSYKCSRGKVNLKGTKGNIELKSLAGNITIREAEGRLKCDMSTGTLTVASSRIEKESSLYISYGDIYADYSDLDSSGKYTIKAANGKIRVKLPETAGWSLLAKSTSGRIENKLEPAAAKEILKAPSGELYGDVRGGGPDIFLYTDMGDILLN